MISYAAVQEMSQIDFAVTADASRMQYELDYTEGISQQMRIPDRLKVGPGSSIDPPPQFPEESHSAMMQVPERIVVAGDEADLHFSRPRELDLIQSIPVESVELKAPPHVLTLQDQPLDFLEPEQHPEPSQLKGEIRPHTRSRREHRSGESSGARHNGQIVKYDAVSPSPSAPVRVCPPLVSPEDWPSVGTVGGVLSYIQLTTRRAYEHVLAMVDDSHRRTALVTLDASLEAAPEDLKLADAPALRRQIVKLNRRLQVLEHENKERARREMVVYSLTVAFWLVNAWMWVRR
ncbi:mitochondrial fission factor homolog A isoform X3 [Ictalurus furcatus]|uniref:mitochondrial fission factor homolog A isoform X2 n=1 Tax=Ictalurus furcatus TaxID=66913 RepID=UPI0023502636|nr:mitochondrial fission factor homolog A isoform X2 [Ictalurus furcatus]XP_053507607.1 mitochondrial fission factor homolog A isoform X3 [Ictalurus furcatus]